MNLMSRPHSQVPHSEIQSSIGYVIYMLFRRKPISPDCAKTIKTAVLIINYDIGE